MVVSMHQNVNHYILTSLQKPQAQMDQSSPHKTRYTETNRKENGEEPQTQWHKENFPSVPLEH